LLGKKAEHRRWRRGRSRNKHANATTTTRSCSRCGKGFTQLKVARADDEVGWRDDGERVDRSAQLRETGEGGPEQTTCNELRQNTLPSRRREPEAKRRHHHKAGLICEDTGTTASAAESGDHLTCCKCHSSAKTNACAGWNGLPSEKGCRRDQREPSGQ